MKCFAICGLLNNSQPGPTDVFSKHTTWDPAFQLELDPNKKLVILFSPFRGGSSFLGQLFDQNSAVQYLFEPFHDLAMRTLVEDGSLMGSASRHTEADLRMLYLQQILHNCTMFATVFYEKYEYCGSVDEHLARFNSTKCIRGLLRSGETHQEICKYRDTTVLKVIRLQYLSDIMKIQNIKSANIKIIHLTRHPVPLMMSRRTAGHYFYLKADYRLPPALTLQKNRIQLAWETFDYCYKTLQNIRYLESNVWMKERYMRLSHEELSLRPIETAQTVYNFLDMELTDNLKEILTNLTSGAATDITKNVEAALNTAKNSTFILEKWKRFSRTIKTFEVAIMETECAELYKVTGVDFELDYNFISNGVLRDSTLSAPIG